MSHVTSLDDLSHYSSNVITSNINSTSNLLIGDITNKITDIYNNDAVFYENFTVTKDLTVSGDLTVNGTTVAINTDAYTTEILQIVSTNVDNNEPVLKIVGNSDVGNIIEVLKDTNTVITVDNSGNMTTTGTINGASAAEIGKLAGIGSTTIISQLNAKQGLLSSSTDVTVKDLTATGGKFTSSLVFERNAPYFHITDTATAGGPAATASLHVNSEYFYILSGGSSICQSINLNTQKTTFAGEVDVNSDLNVAGNITTNKIKLNYVDGNGIQFYSNTDWAIYMSSAGAGNSFSGDTACSGYNFTDAAIRIRTNKTQDGFIYETPDEICKFSVRGSDGSGYFAGDLTVAGDTIALPNTIPSGLTWGDGSYLGRASGQGHYSTSATTGDVILRSANTTNLLLQSGDDGYALKIDSNNNAEFVGDLQVNSNLTIAGSTTIKNTTINVGRGDVYIENNNFDNADGKGITIRTSSNPTTGSIFSVRSSGQANRLWVGQEITTTGINDFGVGHTGSNGAESNLSEYKFQVDAGTGEVRATGNITAYYSDERLKTKISKVKNPLEIMNQLNAFYYKPNEIAFENGIKHTKTEIGLSAQEVQKVLPEIVKLAPLDVKIDEEGNMISKSGNNYLTLQYERLVPVLVESIKELNKNNNALLEEINLIKKKLEKK